MRILSEQVHVFDVFRFFEIVDGKSRSACFFFAIRDQTVGMINHIFIPIQHTTLMISLGKINFLVASGKYFYVVFFRIRGKVFFLIIARNTSDQAEIRKFLFQSEYHFCRK